MDVHFNIKQTNKPMLSKEELIQSCYDVLNIISQSVETLNQQKTFVCAVLMKLQLGQPISLFDYIALTSILEEEN